MSPTFVKGMLDKLIELLDRANSITAFLWNTLSAKDEILGSFDNQLD